MKKKFMKTKSLNKIQLRAIDILFESNGSEPAVLHKLKISRNKWEKWLSAPQFTAEISKRIDSLSRQAKILLTNYIPAATAKLIQLCGSENDEIARKAAVDILKTNESVPATENPEKSPPAATMISQETASKILASLANQPR